MAKPSVLALSVKDLAVTLGEKEILHNLNFEVKKGETLVILGPNGAGKTTLLRALLDLIPHQGEVSWNVNNISYLPPNELLQRKELLPLTVSDFYSLKNVSSRRLNKSLESVGLDKELKKARLSSLSTGQFQRLSIAWALVDNPDTLIFDEPTSGIDIGGTETIYSLLHNFWKKDKLTIILVTHEINVVWEHANNVLCLNKTSVCHGTPDQVLTTQNLHKLYGAGIKYHHH
jgi:ABC-type Mn2+/Zn2+ transport system ATPase subunit